MIKKIWNNGYVTTEVSSVDMFEANTCEANRVKWVTDLAAISRGKYEAKRPEARYRALMKEAALGTPSRPFEFLPVILGAKVTSANKVLIYDTLKKDRIEAVFNNPIKEMSFEDFHNNFGGPMGFVLDEKLYTNMRACINAGIPYDKIPYNTPEQIKEGKFFTIRGKAPMFVWAQVPNTHTFLSKEAQSDRYAPKFDYWFPDDFIERTREYCKEYKHNKEATNEQLKIGPRICLITTMETDGERIDFMKSISQEQVQLLFEELGYKAEIYTRALYYFKYKEFVVTGWGINPKVWNHLFNERNANKDVWKNGTQKETEQLVVAIKELYNKKLSK